METKQHAREQLVREVALCDKEIKHHNDVVKHWESIRNESLSDIARLDMRADLATIDAKEAAK